MIRSQETDCAPSMATSDLEHFSCRRCGACCRTTGYVHLVPGDIDAIAELLQLDVAAFTDRYTRLTRGRAGLSLKEQKDGACVFLDDDNECRIESAKPRQCRQFPAVWRYKDMQNNCKGWNRDENDDD